jgi:Fic family protein
MSSTTPLLCDPSDKAQLETRNNLEQIDFLTDLVVGERRVVDIRSSHVLDLHRLAVQDIYPCGGNFRDARWTLEISDSEHVPPEAALVKIHVENALQRVNEQRLQRPALARAAYALWRFNWIHAFCGGNGRTSRAVAYLILCLDVDMMLPGTPSMPTQIAKRKAEYIHALKVADAGERDHGEPDLSAMSYYLHDIMIRQLTSAHKPA